MDTQSLCHAYPINDINPVYPNKIMNYKLHVPQKYKFPKIKPLMKIKVTLEVIYEE